MSSLFTAVEILHRLVVAVRFFDIFTGETLRIPLTVSIPILDLQAFHAVTDDTYRFIITNRDFPAAGSYDLAVEISGGTYEARERMSVTLPVTVLHPPPVVRPDYLAEFPLWPTRLRRPPAGETAVTGRIISGGATNVDGLRVFLFVPPGPPPARPFAYTNSAGEFLYRLPQLQASMSGGSKVVTATLDIEVRDPVFALVAPVAPGSIVVDLGKQALFEFNVP